MKKFILPLIALSLCLSGCSKDTSEEDLDPIPTISGTPYTRERDTYTDYTVPVETETTMSKIKGMPAEETSVASDIDYMEEETVSLVSNPTEEDTLTVAESTTVAQITEAPVITTTEVITTTVAATTEDTTSTVIVEPDITMSQQALLNRDFSFFDDSLFIGDSVCSGLKLYSGLLDVQHVAARGNIGSWNIDKYTFQYENSTKEADYKSIVELYKPHKVFIWMGLNDIYTTTEETRISNLQIIADNIHSISPESKVYVLSMTPINSKHKWFANDALTTIKSHNSSLEAYCSESDSIEFINVFDCLLDNGVLANSYDGGDGLHLSNEAYYVVLNTVISHFNGNIST